MLTFSAAYLPWKSTEEMHSSRSTQSRTLQVSDSHSETSEEGSGGSRRLVPHPFWFPFPFQPAKFGLLPVSVSLSASKLQFMWKQKTHPTLPAFSGGVSLCWMDNKQPLLSGFPLSLKQTNNTQHNHADIPQTATYLEPPTCKARATSSRPSQRLL